MNQFDIIVATWNLDPWSIGKETFRKITEILPVGSTILEFGSGAGTGILSKFYNMKSIESDIEWLNKYKSTYFYVPLTPCVNKYPEFPEDPYWHHENVMQSVVPTIGHYDCILIDGPKGFRGGLYYNRHLFNFKNSVVIFDDVHDIHHYRLMDLIAKDVNRKYTIYNDSYNKQFGVLN